MKPSFLWTHVRPWRVKVFSEGAEGSTFMKELDFMVSSSTIGGAKRSARARSRHWLDNPKTVIRMYQWSKQVAEFNAATGKWKNT